MKQSEATKELLRLAAENPDLPIYATVYSEVVAEDGYNWWMGKITHVRLDECYVDRWHRVFSRYAYEADEYYLAENTENYELIDELDNLSEEEENTKLIEWFNSLPWEKCIMVYVDVP